MAREAFPRTKQTWIDEQLDRGAAGRAELNRHVMEVYAWPLEIYLKGIPYVRGTDHADTVRGFFIDRLSRPDFFADWQSSGRRLRHWLMGGLWHYLKEQHRRERKLPLPLADDEAALGSDRVRDADRAYVVSLVHRACEIARAECEARGLATHWQVFIRHDEHGEAYSNLASDFGIDERRAGVMARTARKRFEEAVHDVMTRDGVPRGEVEREMRTMLEDLQG